MAKPSIPRLSSLRGWPLVLIFGLILTAVALLDRGGLDEVRPTADGSTGCQLEVTTDQLNVRAGPSQDAELIRVLTLRNEVDGTAVVSDGYRQLEDGTWAVDQFLTPLPDTNCG